MDFIAVDLYSLTLFLVNGINKREKGREGERET